MDSGFLRVVLNNGLHSVIVLTQECEQTKRDEEVVTWADGLQCKLRLAVS